MRTPRFNPPKERLKIIKEKLTPKMLNLDELRALDTFTEDQIKDLLHLPRPRTWLKYPWADAFERAVDLYDVARAKVSNTTRAQALLLC